MKSLTPVPETYLKPATNHGTVVKIDYKTDSGNGSN